MVQDAAYYPTLLGQLAEDGENKVSFAVTGTLVVSADDTELEAIRKRVQARVVADPGAGTLHSLDADQARELFPPLAPDLDALHLSGAARVDGRHLREALLRAAGTRGAGIVEGAPELTMTADRVTGVNVGGELISTDSTVIAAGAWSPELLVPLGVQLDVVPQRGQIVHLDLPRATTERWPIVQPLTGHYLLGFPGGGSLPVRHVRTAADSTTGSPPADSARSSTTRSPSPPGSPMPASR
jgi:D-amino-acid dehydrogenase